MALLWSWNFRSGTQTWFRAQVEDAAHRAAEWRDAHSPHKAFCATSENLELQRQRIALTAKESAWAIDVNAVCRCAQLALPLWRTFRLVLVSRAEL